ncbi:MAG: hypothetical protein JXM72_12470 [Deltaproteobacteria bacterium]|nr:hypothetical protein [Deltaproteobacteria bacterium]
MVLSRNKNKEPSSYTGLGAIVPSLNNTHACNPTEAYESLATKGVRKTSSFSNNQARAKIWLGVK